MTNSKSNLIFRIINLSVFIILITAVNLFAQYTQITNALLEKDTVRILVTDSGLGGFSVAAGIDSILSANKSLKNVQIIFCNALPKSNFRYNELNDAQSKADIFSGILYKMQGYFKPDIILIACNTLSVVYPLTDFSKNAHTPVLGIVELGVKITTDSLMKNPDASAIIMGTETTIQSSAHKDLLIKNGISNERIAVQSFPNLESEIQADPSSDMVNNLIDFYLDEMPKQSQKESESKVFAAMCCTHYGFAKSAFEKKLNSIFKNVCMINPNESMIRLFEFSRKEVTGTNNVSIALYSQAVLSTEEIKGVCKLISPVSAKAGKALENYIRLNGIF